MLTGKQRSYLKGLANGLDTTVYIGKSGITEQVLTAINRELNAKELVKCAIGEGSDLDPKTVCNEVAEELNAEFVQAIGRRFILYRRAKDPTKRKIQL